MHIEVKSIKYSKLESNEKQETSKDIRKRVNKARLIQQQRYEQLNIMSNSELNVNQIQRYCYLNKECKKILEIAFNKLNLSARAYNKIIKVARTIADLEESQNIEKKHLLEAIQYRSLDRKYGDKI